MIARHERPLETLDNRLSVVFVVRVEHPDAAVIEMSDLGWGHHTSRLGSPPQRPLVRLRAVDPKRQADDAAARTPKVTVFEIPISVPKRPNHRCAVAVVPFMIVAQAVL